MIKSDRQFKYTQKKLKEFSEDLKAILKQYSADKKKAALLSQGYKEHIDQLRKEIAEYEFMKKAPLPHVLPALSPAEIGRQLTRLRIARGLTQAQLAAKMGCKQSDISRMEREDYGVHSISLLRKAADVLKANMEIRFILPDKKAPKGKSLTVPLAISKK